MYLSRLSFHTLPGKTHEVEENLKELGRIIQELGGGTPRILRTHFASLGSEDVVFEQEAPEITALEEQIQRVTESGQFQDWSQRMAGLLREPPKREVYRVIDGQ